MTTYTVATDRLPALQAAAKSLLARAKRLGVALSIVLGTAFEVGYRRHPETDRAVECSGAEAEWFRSFTPVEVVGEALVLPGGWRLVAALDHVRDEETGEASNLLRSVPGGGDLPAEFRSSSHLRCDHCGRAIPRASTYVLRNAEGQLKQIGSTCIRDYLGGHDAQSAIAAFELEFELRSACGDEDEGYGGGRGGERLAPTRRWLAYVAVAIRLDGWLSRGKAREQERLATADLAWRALWPQTDKDIAWAAKRQPTTEDTAIAQATLDYVKAEFGARSPESLSDYEHNLLLACRMSGTGSKMAGIVASAIACYQRDLVRRQQTADLRGSKHVGAVGDKIHVWGALISEPRSFASEWGGSWLVKVLTEEGNVLTAFSSSKPDAAVGARVLWGGTVKAHGEFKGVKETKMGRFSDYTAEGAAQWQAKEAKRVEREAKKAAKAAYDATPEGQAKAAKLAARKAQALAKVAAAQLVAAKAAKEAALEHAAKDAGEAAQERLAGDQPCCHEHERCARVAGGPCSDEAATNAEGAVRARGLGLCPNCGARLENGTCPDRTHGEGHVKMGDQPAEVSP